ncbi:hypothetical protein D3C85_1682930 [compost metagenome]
MGIAQVARAFAVLLDDANSGLDDVLGHGRFAGRNLFLVRDRSLVLPGKPGRGQCPAEQPDAQQPQERLAQKGTEAQPERDQH